MNILTSLKESSDIKWSLKSLNNDQLTPEYQVAQKSNDEKTKLLEESVKLSIQEVCKYFLYKYSSIY